MATFTANYHHSNQQRPNSNTHIDGSTIAHWFRADWSELSPTAFVLGMAGYFLLLGSIAVVVLSNQFPWFMAAPITILLAVAYLRHGEAKRAQDKSRV